MTRAEKWKEEEIKHIQEMSIEEVTRTIMMRDWIYCEDCCANSEKKYENCEENSCDCEKYIRMFLEQEA